MNAAKKAQPMQLEIGENTAATTKEKSGVQLEIAGIVDKYATAVADVQKGAIGNVSKLSRAVAFAGALAVAPAAGMAESPYEPLAANASGVSLVLKEEPSQNADIKTIMERYKQGAKFEKIASMSVEQRRKLMEYYKKAKAAWMKDRIVAIGLGSIVGGYSDIEDVKVFVSEYQKTGKMGKNIPLPYVNFVNATEDFPEAQAMFASELEATKKMEAQIKSIIEMIGNEAKRESAEAKRESAEAKRESAEAKRESAEAKQRIKVLNEILKAIK